MVGFAAEAAGDEIRIDAREIESAQWATRTQVRREVQAGTLILPSVKSIARRLIDDWLDAD
jgi:NADH pyrophosphatase NudC (nudix superfamily)